MKLEFPSCDADLAMEPCAICGAIPEDQEYVYPSGMRGMSVDSDLCLECCSHLWRALKELYPDSFRMLAWELLGHYPLTMDAIKKSGILGTCPHERLNEDGICRQCGTDRRGIQ